MYIECWSHLDQFVELISIENGAGCVVCAFN